ncbi:MAG: ABC transporter permease subunit [Deltaproteobacteria bacterium]|nr:ABC transporter permease subunit [Deltaproteobacteria bacterium]MBW2723922.1 ABC transporter permease subunit [Deltaproteobacteria bacterium]
MIRIWALIRKEFSVLFGSPIAYGVLFMVALVTAITFFEHLRLYNQILFVFASNTMGGFESDTIPTHVNLIDTVFNPVMEQLGVLLIIPIPLVTMRVFAEERERGTDELLLTSGLTALQVIVAKYSVTFCFVILMMAVSFVYPVTAIEQGGLGMLHLASVFIGLSLLAIGISSIGLVCSAYTSSQIVAAASTVALAFIFYDFGWTHAFVSESVANALDAVSLHQRFAHMAEGLILLSDLVYFAALVVISAVLSRLSFELRRVGA